VLTMHLSIILAIDQLNANFLFCNKFIIYLDMFRALLCSSSGCQNCIIQHLVSSHSVGGRPMHSCTKNISKPFSHICKFSQTNGIFPDRCKYALVLPVYKKGERTNRSNYQPICLLLKICQV